AARTSVLTAGQTTGVLALTPQLAFVDHPIGYLIGLAIFGLIVGALARLAIPGRQPMGCLGTMAAGIAGSFLAGIIGGLVFGRNYAPGWIATILGAALIVWLVSRYQQRSPGSRL